jgi:hypothetical protein
MHDRLCCTKTTLLAWTFLSTCSCIIHAYPPIVANAFLSSDLAVSISSNSRAEIAHLACFCVCSTCFLVGGAEVRAGIVGADGGGDESPSPCGWGTTGGADGAVASDGGGADGKFVPKPFPVPFPVPLLIWRDDEEVLSPLARLDGSEDEELDGIWKFAGGIGVVGDDEVVVGGGASGVSYESTVICV